ncbi:Dynactin subunit 6 [Strongyloides ratti]|uniref:Dynactin subunit 6 n=1 Tax=Strongyloides ratti TaxID=34506 RepID=A0A090LCE7_STRRB|nr:Dynactin subunit 6 [Strongyloides ratti]CEF65778.1 Dynactin subunit 6 [Strongyloides ratti]
MSKTKLVLHENSQVLEKSILKGEITVGNSTVIQPLASILATNGPIVIGEHNIIEEFVTIENLNENGEPLIIGDKNTFEVQSTFRGKSVGNQNLFSVRSRVDKNVVITDFCSIGIGCVVPEGEELQPQTVVFGKNSDRRIGCEKGQNTEDELDYLLKVFPKYHKILKN